MRLTRWDQTLDTEMTNEAIKELACIFARRISDPAIREHITSCISDSLFSDLCSYDVRFDKLSAPDAYNLRQALAFYSKRQDLDIGVDKEAVAFATFIKAEQLCSETNAIFKKWGAGSFQFEPAVERVLFNAQRKIATLLGDVPSLEAIKARFGPGATTQLTKRAASARNKLSQRFACSEELAPYVTDVLEELPGWIPFGDSDTALVTVHIHDGTLGFVPKSAKTYRGIAVEPALNTMWQIGIGNYIAARLRTVGIDIRDQTRNQILAKEASVSGALATLDLSSASDTVASELVAHLLPYDWYVFLSKFRTGTLSYKGQRIKLQKFSSMGNGFTFPLETLIFWALSKSCCEKHETVSVYGDDIIAPVSAYPLLSKVLTACGFILNKDKSFASGPFRESCGKDYLSGIDIRPVFLKDRLSGENLFTLHNYFARRLDPEACSYLVSLCDPSFLLWGPDGYGDGHLLGDCTLEPHRRKIPRNKKEPGGWGGYIFETYTWQSRKQIRPVPGDYVYPFYSIYTSEPSDVLDDLPFGLFRAKRYLYGKRSLVDEARLKFSSLSHTYDRRGLLGTTLPGKRGYKRISIYTFQGEWNPLTGANN